MSISMFDEHNISSIDMYIIGTSIILNVNRMVYIFGTKVVPLTSNCDILFFVAVNHHGQFMHIFHSFVKHTESNLFSYIRYQYSVYNTINKLFVFNGPKSGN